MIAALTLLISLASLLLGTDEAEIVFVGDAMQHQSQLDAAARAARANPAAGTHSYEGTFSALRPLIASADYAVVNLECPLGGAPYAGYPMFCAPDAWARALADAGFDLALTANNHILDRRDRGLLRTLTMLDSIGLPHVGTTAAGAPPAQTVASVGNFRVGFLNYTYGTNGIRPGAGVHVNYIDTAAMRRDIALARAAGAELVAVCVHWGVEYRLLPEPTQRSLAAALHAMGADMVIGAHPHVIQPMELRDGHLTVYSLGNLISGMRTPDTRGGLMAAVTLRRDSTGRAFVAGATWRPVFTLTPASAKENFRVADGFTPAPDGVREAQRRDFLQRARRVLDAHCRGVAPDTLSPLRRARERALRRRHYLEKADPR